MTVGTVVVESLGWIGLGLNIWGNWKLTNIDRSGWVIRLACNAAYIVYSASCGAWALLVNHIVFAGINVVGYRKWAEQAERLRKFPPGEEPR